MKQIYVLTQANGQMLFFSTSKRAFNYCKDMYNVHKRFSTFNKWLHQDGNYLLSVDGSEKLSVDVLNRY